MGAIAITNRPLVLEIFWLWLHRTEGLFLMAVALTSHWNVLTTLAFLKWFYMVLINKKQVLKESSSYG